MCVHRYFCEEAVLVFQMHCTNYPVWGVFLEKARTVVGLQVWV